MIHRFIHIGDTHLDSRSARNADRLSALEQIVDDVHAMSDVAAILWPGDLFNGESTVDDRNHLASVLQDLAATAPVVLVPGNHDRPGDLDLFARLQAPYPVHLLKTPDVTTLCTATGRHATILPLPYVFKGGLVGAGVDHAALGAEAERLLTPILTAGAAELQHAADAGAIPLVALHMNVGGARSSIGQPQIGREIELTPGLLSLLPGEAAIMANHIHLHQVVDRRVVYAGSIARMDFGEMEPKGYVAWTWNDSEATPRWSWEFVPLDVPAQIAITGQLGRAGFLPDAPLPCTVGADVKATYRFLKADRDILDEDEIRAAALGCRSLKIEAIPEQEHTVRAPEIAAATTIEDKALRCAALQGVAVTDGLRAKLDALQSTDPDAILASLQEVRP